MSSKRWSKASWGVRNNKVKKKSRSRTCKICGREAVKGQYCQSCADFIREMQKRDQAVYT